MFDEPNHTSLLLQAKPHREVTHFVLKLCLGSAVLAIMRTPLLPIAKLGDVLHKYVPDLPPSTMYGKVSGAACEKLNSWQAAPFQHPTDSPLRYRPQGLRSWLSCAAVTQDWELTGRMHAGTLSACVFTKL
jgi:hypothetical protein